MALMLEVTSPHAMSMGANARRLLGDTELKIGREQGNDWVFPQEYVSRRQAIIRCVNGMYFLEQVGSCPLAINDTARPLERNRIARLSSGDRILLDDIEIRVSEIDASALPPPSASMTPVATPVAPDSRADDPLALPLDPRAAAPARPADPLAGFATPAALGGAGAARSVDPLELIPVSATGVHPVRSAPKVPAFNSILDDAIPISPSADPPASRPGVLSDRWWEPAAPVQPAAPIPRPAQRPPDKPADRAIPSDRALPLERAPPPAAAAPAQAAILEQLLRGASLDPTQAAISPEVAQQLGRVLRIVVEGTMQVLQARNEIRREFRLPTTQVARTDNNPLKFSADASDALHKLLVQRSPAYLDTVSAFADAFDDIRVHQLAMLESLRAAFNHMLGQFDPQLLAQQFEQGGGRVVRGLGGKTRLWESFVARYADLVADRDFAFRRLFGEEFGKAYEQNLGRQKRMIQDGGHER